MHSIDADTRLITLLGYPIEHTLSPLLHNTAFDHQDLNFVYLASSVHPDNLAEAVEGIRALGIAGANVTIPHKERVLPLIDQLTEEAAAVGAVNTIVPETSDNGAVTLAGDNTDIAGFLEPLQPYSEQVTGENVLIFGSGGAARAVAYAVVTSLVPEQCTIAARSPDKAEQLITDLEAHDTTNSLRVCPLEDAGTAIRSSKLLINATPVGMHPNADETIWPNGGDFQPEQIAYDLVYRPRETRWLRDAAHRGTQTIGGLQMLVAQAAAAYQQWTNRSMPLGVVKDTLTEKWS